MQIQSPSSHSPTSPPTNYQNPTDSFPTDQKLKKRTPFRAQKLAGDIHLLSGRIEEALFTYNSICEMMKSNGDFLWYAWTLEYITCANILISMKNAGIPVNILNFIISKLTALLAI